MNRKYYTAVFLVQFNHLSEIWRVDKTPRSTVYNRRYRSTAKPAGTFPSAKQDDFPP